MKVRWVFQYRRIRHQWPAWGLQWNFARWRRECRRGQQNDEPQLNETPSLLGGIVFGCGRIDKGLYVRNTIRREAPLLSVFPNHCFVRSDVHAIDLVSRNIAVEPLNLRSHLVQHAARFLGNGLQFFARQVTCPCDFSFNGSPSSGFLIHILRTLQASENLGWLIISTGPIAERRMVVA
jgi:hypothetical protein